MKVAKSTNSRLANKIVQVVLTKPLFLSHWLMLFKFSTSFVILMRVYKIIWKVQISIFLKLLKHTSFCFFITFTQLWAICWLSFENFVRVFWLIIDIISIFIISGYSHWYMLFISARIIILISLFRRWSHSSAE